MFRSWLKTHCSLRGCLHVDSVCCVCAWVRATSGCVWHVPTDCCWGAHPKPPLTQPTTFPPLGYPAVLREATWNLEGSKFIRVYRRGRRQDVAGERRCRKRRGGQKDLSHTRRLRGRREGWNKVRNSRNQRRVEHRERGMLAHVQGYHWQKSRHLPAASWRQQHSDRRMLPRAASVCWCAHLCLCVYPCAQHGGCEALRALLMC